MSELQGAPTEDLPTMLENMRNSRDEYKKKVEALKNEIRTQDNCIEEQRVVIEKLIDAVCDLSRAVGK